MRQVQVTASDLYVSKGETIEQVPHPVEVSLWGTTGGIVDIRAGEVGIGVEDPCGKVVKVSINGTILNSKVFE